MSKMKKISIITIILYCFFVTTCFAATGTITVNAARLRQEANTNSTVLTNIYKGEKVEILETTGEWYKVKYGNNIGYLKNNLMEADTTSTTDSIENTDSEPVNNSENTTNQVVESSKLITNAKTHIRFQPNMMSVSILEIDSGKELTKVSEMGNWFQVTDGVIKGWILKNKVTTSLNEEKPNAELPEEPVIETPKVEEPEKNEKPEEKEPEKTTVENDVSSINKKATVNVETAKIRETASKTSKVLGFLDYNDVITITAQEGEWYKFTGEGVTGYIHNTLVTLKEENVTSRGNTEERTNETEKVEEPVDDTTIDSNTNNIVNDVLTAPTSSNGQAVVDFAKQFLGYPYVVGGKNPTSGFDCSGFTRYVFLQFGHSLGATAATQNNLGTEIPKEQLQPGDLILFYDEGMTKIGHTGIYISNGDFIHSANPKRGVVTDNLNTNSYYRERFITARRIVQ